MQALILAGGAGTRLRPLTSSIPKPVVPLVDRPFIAFMLEWLKGHGVDEVVLACGYLAGGVRDVIGDGARYGLRISYLEEPEPLGTGGAVRFAEDALADRFLMLNGDVLTDIDLTAQIAQHEKTGARATLALHAVEDPSAYGLVRTAGDATVTEFLEKPKPEEIDTNLINAGAYVLERSVLEDMPAAGAFSIERDVFPRLVGRGLYGYEATGYWMDIGTPERYLQGTWDILEGRVRTAPVQRMAADASVTDGAEVGARVVLGAGARVGEGARIDESVVLAGAHVGASCVLRRTIIGPGVHIEAGQCFDGEVVA